MSAVSKGREHGAVVHRGVSFVGTLAVALAKDVGVNVRRAVGYPIGLVQGAVLGEAKPAAVKPGDRAAGDVAPIA